MLSNFFIDRPLFAIVVSAFIVIAGLASFRALPVSMYPDIAPPSVGVNTVYPGASADVIAETVAAPLEQALNGVEEDGDFAVVVFDLARQFAIRGE